MKRRIKLAESDIHRIIKESVKKILRESAKVEKTFENENGIKTYVSIERPSRVEYGEPYYGSWECWEDEDDEDYGEGYYEEGGFWVDPKTKEVVDYDGCDELPIEVQKTLEEPGYYV